MILPLVVVFRAIDWQSAVYLNGKLIGNHTGGYVPQAVQSHPMGVNPISVAVRLHPDGGQSDFGCPPTRIPHSGSSCVW